MRNNNSHICEAWVSAERSAVLQKALERAAIHCSDSLKALFEDFEKACGKTLLASILNYVSTGAEGEHKFVTESFRAVRINAETVRSWDYGKGPYLSLSDPDLANLEGRFAKLSSRCQTVTITVEATNTKFPAKPGEANVPLIRASVMLNPHDTAKFDSCYELVRSEFTALKEQASDLTVLLSA